MCSQSQDIGSTDAFGIFRRVAATTAANSVTLLGRSYATTDDGRELLVFSDTASEIQNRWKVESLLCRVDLECVEGGHHSMVVWSQRLVGGILTELNSGTSLEDAISKHISLA